MYKRHEKLLNSIQQSRSINSTKSSKSTESMPSPCFLFLESSHWPKNNWHPNNLDFLFILSRRSKESLLFFFYFNKKNKVLYPWNILLYNFKIQLHLIHSLKQHGQLTTNYWLPCQQLLWKKQSDPYHWKWKWGKGRFVSSWGRGSYCSKRKF